MLAQNFKRAADLGISEAEVDALIKVLGMLERGELAYAPHNRPNGPNGFNMGAVDCQKECGTVACICGWARFVGGEKVFDIYDGTYPDSIMTELFLWGVPWRTRVKPEQAAVALRSYLTTGYPSWEDAMAQS